MKHLITLLAAAVILTPAVQAHRPGGAGGGPRPDISKWDTDGDGVLSAEERAAMKAAIEAERAAFIAKWDTDGNGVLSAEERAAAKAAAQAARLEAAKAKFAELDADDDGSLSLEEFTAGAPEGASAERIAAAFARKDADASGGLSEEEFLAHPSHKGRDGSTSTSGTSSSSTSTTAKKRR